MKVQHIVKALKNMANAQLFRLDAQSPALIILFVSLVRVSVYLVEQPFSYI